MTDGDPAGLSVSPDDPADAAIPGSWRALGLPGLVDIHVHFMPERLLARVWRYFDEGGPLVGRPVPVAYRLPQEERALVQAIMSRSHQPRVSTAAALASVSSSATSALASWTSRARTRPST